MSQADKIVANKMAITGLTGNTHSFPASGGWEWNPLSGKMIWSSSFYKVLGLANNEIKPSVQSLIKIVHPSDLERVKTQLIPEKWQTNQLRLDFKILTRNGQMKRVRLRGESLRDAQGGLIKIVGFLHEITDEMLTDEKVRKSEQRLASHVEHTPLGVIEWDMDFTVVEWNPAAERIFGYSKQEAIGKNAMDIIVPDSFKPHVAEVWKGLQSLKGGERSYNANVTKDGRLIKCEWYNTPLLDNEGMVIGVASLVQDVTETESARKALQESEERYRLLVELSPVATAVHSEGKLVFVNKACLDMFQETQENIIGLPVLDFVAPEYRKMVAERMKLMMVDGKRVPPMEQKFMRRDGSVIEVETSAAPYTFDGKKAVMVVFQDITERKIHENSLRKANHFLQNLMETIPNPVFYKDAHGVFTGCNKAFEEMIGKNASDVVGKTVYNICSPELASVYHEKDQELFKHGGIQIYESQINRINGEYRNVIFYKACYYEPDGAIGGIVGVILDITEIKRTERMLTEARDEAERASKAKSTFLSSMSHEVRTPLNSIIGFASLLGSDSSSPLSAQQRDFVNRVKTSGEHLLELFNEIMDLSRIESGNVEMSMGNADLCEVVLASMSAVSELSKKRGIKLHGPENFEECLVIGDLSRLIQVVTNLLANGIKYNRAGGKVSISYKAMDNGKVWLSVSDTGPGVPPEKVEKMFDPFDRAGAEGMSIKGIGIGLTVVKKLVNMMGGKVEVETELGKGSVFSVIMPKGEKDPASKRYDAPSKFPIEENRAILVVDDNQDSLELMRVILEDEAGFNTITAQDGMTSVELARTHRPILILMDITLPGMDGYEALRVLRQFKETNAIPVVAVSANVLPSDVERGLNAGFNRYIKKPLLAQPFVEVVRQVIEESRGSQVDV